MACASIRRSMEGKSSQKQDLDRQPPERHRPSGRRKLGFALACFTMLLWGALPLALKALLRTIDSSTVVWYRFLIASGILGLILLARGGLPRLSKLTSGGRLLLALATLGLAANYVSFMVGLDLTTAADAQVIIQTAPLLLALGGILIFRERFSRLQWGGFALLLVGLGLFFASQLAELVTARERYLSGVAIVLLAAVFWAVYGLAQKELLRHLPSQGIMLSIYFGCALIFTPLAEIGSVGALDTVGWTLLVATGLCTILAYGAFSESLAHLEASRVGAILSLTPVATLSFSWAAARAGLIEDPAIAGPSLLAALTVVAGSMLVAVGAGVGSLVGSRARKRLRSS